MYLLLSGASLYFHGGFLVGPLSWCLEASVFFARLQADSQNTWSRLFFFSACSMSNKLEKHMPEQKIDVTIHDDNWRGNGCGFLLIFWIVIMFLLNLLKALMTLASCFLLPVWGYWAYFFWLELSGKHGIGCGCCLIGGLAADACLSKG